MWLFTKYGFFSAVSARKSNSPKAPVDPTRIMIRARKREHLEALIDRMTDENLIPNGWRVDPRDWAKAKVVESKETDYAFRLFVPKHVWADAVFDLVHEIAYDNFKGEVHKTLKDDQYESALHSVWAVGLRMQPKRGWEEEDWEPTDVRPRSPDPLAVRTSKAAENVAARKDGKGKKNTGKVSDPALSVVFVGRGGTTYKAELKDETDEEIRAARERVEFLSGKPLPNDPQTGFPSFTLYRGKEEIGGG